MSSLLSQASKKTGETVKQGEEKVEECVHKGKEIGHNAFKHGEEKVEECVHKGKEIGGKVIEEGCHAAKNTCDQVTGEASKKVPGWKKP